MQINTRLLAALALVAVLCGCVHTRRVLVPQTVPLPVRQYVAIPPELTQPCPIAKGQLRDVIDVAKKREKALEACNGQLKAIRELSDKAAATNKPAPTVAPAKPPR